MSNCSWFCPLVSCYNGAKLSWKLTQIGKECMVSCVEQWPTSCPLCPVVRGSADSWDPGFKSWQVTLFWSFTSHCRNCSFAKKGSALISMFWNTSGITGLCYYWTEIMFSVEVWCYHTVNHHCTDGEILCYIRMREKKSYKCCMYRMVCST